MQKVFYEKLRKHFEMPSSYNHHSINYTNEQEKRQFKAIVDQYMEQNAESNRVIDLLQSSFKESRYRKDKDFNYFISQLTKLTKNIECQRVFAYFIKNEGEMLKCKAFLSQLEPPFEKNLQLHQQIRELVQRVQKYEVNLAKANSGQSSFKVGGPTSISNETRQKIIQQYQNTIQKMSQSLQQFKKSQKMIEEKLECCNYVIPDFFKEKTLKGKLQKLKTWMSDSKNELSEIKGEISKVLSQMKKHQKIITSYQLIFKPKYSLTKQFVEIVEQFHKINSAHLEEKKPSRYSYTTTIPSVNSKGKVNKDEDALQFIEMLYKKVEGSLSSPVKTLQNKKKVIEMIISSKVMIKEKESPSKPKQTNNQQHRIFEKVNAFVSTILMRFINSPSTQIGKTNKIYHERKTTLFGFTLNDFTSIQEKIMNCFNRFGELESKNQEQISYIYTLDENIEELMGVFQWKSKLDMREKTTQERASQVINFLNAVKDKFVKIKGQNANLIQGRSQLVKQMIGLEQQKNKLVDQKLKQKDQLSAYEKNEKQVQFENMTQNRQIMEKNDQSKRIPFVDQNKVDLKKNGSWADIITLQTSLKLKEEQIVKIKGELRQEKKAYLLKQQELQQTTLRYANEIQKNRQESLSRQNHLKAQLILKEEQLSAFTQPFQIDRTQKDTLLRQKQRYNCQKDEEIRRLKDDANQSAKRIEYQNNININTITELEEKVGSLKQQVDHKNAELLSLKETYTTTLKSLEKKLSDQNDAVKKEGYNVRKLEETIKGLKNYESQVELMRKTSKFQKEKIEQLTLEKKQLLIKLQNIVQDKDRQSHFKEENLKKQISQLKTNIVMIQKSSQNQKDDQARSKGQMVGQYEIKIDDLNKQKKVLSEKIINLGQEHTQIQKQLTKQSVIKQKQLERLQGQLKRSKQQFENIKVKLDLLQEAKDIQLIKLNKVIQDLNRDKSTIIADKQLISKELLIQKDSNQKMSSLILELESKKQNQVLGQPQGFVPFSRTLFTEDIFLNDQKSKDVLISHIQQFVKGVKIRRSVFLYKYDPRNKNNFHMYIDGVKNLLMVVKTKNAIVAGFYPGVHKEKEVMNVGGLLISVSNNESYTLFEKKAGSSNVNIRGMAYDAFYAIYGNAELRVKAFDKKVYSNIGVNNAFYNSRGAKVDRFLNEGDKREVEFEFCEFYQVLFKKDEVQFLKEIG